MALVLMCACKPQTREQIAQKMGDAMKQQVEKSANDRIKKMLQGILENPDTYRAISTDMSYVMNNMIIYDSEAFTALRDLDRSIQDFRKTYGNDTTSQAARNEREAMQSMVGVVVDKINQIKQRPVEFEGIDAFHKFSVEDKHKRRIERGYHFVIHKNNRITLLCDHEELQRVQAFTEQLLTQGVKVIQNE